MTTELHPDTVKDTAVLAVETLIRGVWHPILVKAEGTHPSGSVKHRVAVALVDDLLRRRGGDRDFVLVESTSGNLGAGLAMVCRARELDFVAVVDPRTQPEKLARMRRLGARLDMVLTPDSNGSYLEARLSRVAELCSTDDRYVFADQYHNPAHPAVHRDTTAAEIARQTGGAIEWVAAAVSTGATLGGIRDGLIRSGISPRMLAVDAVGSSALGGPTGPRQLTGLGSTRPSAFLEPAQLDRIEHIADAVALAECWNLRRDTGLALGASAGAVLAAVRSLLAEAPVALPPVCIAADDGRDYASTVYNLAWLREKGLLEASRPIRNRWRIT